MFGKRVGFSVANNKMIQHPYIEQGQGLFEFVGDLLIRLTGLGNARRVIMLSTPIYVAL